MGPQRRSGGRSPVTPVELLDEARKRGIVLEPDGAWLVYRGPKGAMTPDLKHALTQCKADVINHIRGQGSSNVEKRPPRHMLDVWIEVAIPEWERILRESIASGDKSRAAYARGLLRQLGVKGY